MKSGSELTLGVTYGVDIQGKPRGTFPPIFKVIINHIIMNNTQVKPSEAEVQVLTMYEQHRDIYTVDVIPCKMKLRQIISMKKKKFKKKIWIGH